MAKLALAFAVVLLALAGPQAAAGPTATWQGATFTLVCIEGNCHIVAPPVDDQYVNVGTGGFKEVRLTLTSHDDKPLALRFVQAGNDITTPSREVQQTAWLKAPADRVLEVTVLDLESPFVPTGIREGVAFTLRAEYR